MISLSKYVVLHKNIVNICDDIIKRNPKHRVLLKNFFNSFFLFKNNHAIKNFGVGVFFQNKLRIIIKN